eukprot:c4559_g1_i1.p1 GENE.c4559_g1_i1~~c4559_g1_i1.p1  ORF type:complete len:436 (+),score=89.57 c4559_g1_i1:73-1308(+)
MPTEEELRAYLTNHHVNDLLEDLVSRLVEEKPSNIPAFAIDFLGAPHRIELARVSKVRDTMPENRMAKHFSESYFLAQSPEHQNRLLKICRSGIENPDSSVGCYAMNPDDYDTFKPFLGKVIADYHRVTEDAIHINDWNLIGVDGLPDDGQLDLQALGLSALSMRVRVGRNLADFPLPGAMTADDRRAMEKKMTQVFDLLIAEHGGSYNSLTPGHPNHITEQQYDKLVADHIMFKDMAADPYLKTAGISSDWPIGRGCYISADREFIIWVGEEDHLRIMCMQTGTILNTVFNRLHSALETINNIPGLSFARSSWAGYVTSCPTNLGTGMRASVHIALPKLTKNGKDVSEAKRIAKSLGLSVRGIGGEHTDAGEGGIVDISPSARFCITEASIISALYRGVKALKEAEDMAE